MRWRNWLRHNGNGGEEKASEAEHRLRQARADAPMIRRAARDLARLPNDEFAARVAQAFRRTM